MIGAGRDITVTDRDNNGIDQADFNAAIDRAIAEAPIRDGDYIILGDGERIPVQGDWETFKRGIEAQFADQASGRDPRADLQSRLDQARNGLDALLQKAQQDAARLEEQRLNGTDRAGLSGFQATANASRDRLLREIRLIQQLNQQLGQQRNANITADMFKAAGLPEDGGSTGSATMRMTYGGGEGEGAGAGTGAKAMSMGGSAAGTGIPMNWGAQTTDPQLSADALVQSSLMETEIMGSFDSVLSTQNRSKQLYLLFMWAARNAMSGDLMAMYEFMKVVAFIVGKDKANQLRQCGEKVMELQDMSRKYTNMLLEQPLDANNPNSSNEFAKTMTKVKGETENISMSQKLILQICEEFTQVQELMTGCIKNILDANGRVIRKLMS